MPEDEAQEQKKDDGSGGTSQFLGTRGWIVVIAAELITVAFFLVLISLKGGEKKLDNAEVASAKIDLKNYNAHKYAIRDLNYSIPMSGTNSATLSMGLDIVLGLTEEELQNDEGPSDDDWKKFERALEQMDSKIRDHLMSHVIQQSYSHLSSSGGQEKIKKIVKEFVNSEMVKLKLGLSKENMVQDRVDQIQITMFFIQ
jgi:hypothetical protein